MTALGSLPKGFKGVITAVGPNETGSHSRIDPKTTLLVQRLLEMGMVEGAAIEIVLEAPFSGDPIAVKVRGTLIALRRNEAALIQVESS